MVHMKSLLVTIVSAKTKYYEKLIISQQIISARSNVITVNCVYSAAREALGRPRGEERGGACCVATHTLLFTFYLTSGLR